MTQESGPPADVLIVEDDRLMRTLMGEILARAGIRAAEAGDADSAVRMLGEGPGPRVLVTDPGMSGGAPFAGAAQRRWPGLRVVMTSGSWAEAEPLPTAFRLLPKPFRPSVFLREVGALLPPRPEA
ncbi:response regulator receiver protein [Methylobacterium sp. 4-46]|uniref:response regulator n=1 Tax=unclassified Methylobacterium TaxID=2615210 RepID=UPI000152C318|nr:MULTISPECIES: response regulator [Methylobacterium]ACA15271.1 response regulator receiver protein [Methylobacterium sp. 4-46]WFT80998.1 response regulator [Methylobacterium nodulans]